MGGLRYLCAMLVDYWSQETRVLTAKEMTFEMLRVQICLVAVWAREFAVGIFCWNHGLGRRGSSRSRWCCAARRTRKYTTTTLRTNNVSWLRFLIWYVLLLLRHAIGGPESWEWLGLVVEIVLWHWHWAKVRQTAGHASTSDCRRSWYYRRR